MKTLIGIGNAGIDITVRISSDEDLPKLGFRKGSCTFPNYDQALALTKNLAHPSNEPGGVAANVLCTYAALGGTARFIGKTGKDAMGQLFADSLKKFHVKFDTLPYENELSTQIFTAISPDGERSFASYYGASHLISQNDVDPKWFDSDSLLLLDSYMLMSDGGPTTLKYAAETAHKSGSTIIFMPCSLSVIEQRWYDIQELQKFSDALISNQDEALALANTHDINHAIAHLKTVFAWGIITLGAKGLIYFIREGDDIHQSTPIDAPDIINTNGAGDNFAGGFLYGYMRGWQIEKSLYLGQLCAINVLGINGARPNGSLTHLIDQANAKTKQS